MSEPTDTEDMLNACGRDWKMSDAMSDPTDPGPPEPTEVRAIARRRTALAWFWAAGLVMNMANGHKDFPESLRHNLFLLALDAGFWFAAGGVWWRDVRSECRRAGCRTPWATFRYALRARGIVGWLLALCAAYGILSWVYRCAASDFW